MTWHGRVSGRGSHWAARRLNAQFRVWTSSHPSSPKSPVLVGVQTILDLTGYTQGTFNAGVFYGAGTLHCPIMRLRQEAQAYSVISHLLEPEDTRVAFTRIPDGE